MKKISTLFLLLTALLALPLAASAEEVLFDFQNNNLGLTVGTSAAADGNISGKDIVKDGVIMRATSGGTMHARYYYLSSRGNQLQVIKDGRLRFTAPEGKAITKVVFELTTSNIHWSVDKGDGTLSTDMKTWEGNATSVRFLGTGANYIDVIKVTVADATSETVKPAADTYTEVANIAAFNALADGTLAELTLANAEVTATGVDGWTVYVQDATAAAHFYLLDQDFKAGDILNGKMKVAKYVQTSKNLRIGTSEDFSAADYTVTSGTPTYTTGTIADIKTDANIGKLVKLTGVKFDVESKTKGTATDESGSIVINNGTSGMSPYVIKDDLQAYESADITGIVYYVTTGIQIYPLTIEKHVTDASADATFDFAGNPNNWPVSTEVYGDEADAAKVTVLTVGGVKLTSIQNNEYNANFIYKNGDAAPAFRVFRDNAFMLTAPEGKAIIKVVATMAANDFDLTASTGAVADNVWTGNASEVTFTAAATRLISKLDVTLADENSETVKPAAIDAEAADIAAFNAVEDGKTVKLTLTNAKVNGINGGSAYVEDASGATVIKGLTLTAGTALNGYVIGKKSTDSNIDYMGLTPAPFEPQLTATDASTFEATATTLTGKVMTIPAASAQVNYGKLVTLENLAVSGSNKNNMTLKDADDNTIKARGDLFELGDDFTWPSNLKKITGVLVYYMTSWAILPISADAIVAAGAEQSNEALFDFANNNLGLTVGQGGASDDIATQNAGNLAGKVLEQNGVKMTFVNPATMPVRYFYLPSKQTNHLQLSVKGAMLRLTAPEGKSIVEVKVVQNLPESATNFVKWEVDKGAGTWNLDTKTWTGNATSVRFSATGATYINSITVTLADKTGETITPDPDQYTAEVSTLADFNALADGTLAKLTLTNAVITSGMINEWGCYVQDATAGAHFYCTGLDLKVNDVLNGYVYVTKSKQTMGSRIAMAEDTNADNLTITANGTFEPVSGSINEVNIAANVNKVVKLSGVAVKGTSKTAATVTDVDGTTIAINNGTTNAAPYVIKEEMTNIDYAKATVVAILYGSSATENKLYPLSISEDSSDGIATINAINADDVQIYNLQGVRLNSLQRGVNIVNGKKVVIK